MNRTTNCTCTKQQLYHVGCDCIAEREAVIVEVWKDGYASDNKGRAVIAGGLDIAAEVRKHFGPYATIYSKRPVYMPTAEKFDAEYVRQMSIGG